MKNRKIRYAIVGVGHISQVAVLPSFQNSECSELVALVSSDPEKRKYLGEKYNIRHTYSYSQYEECLTSGLIDAVYIALPNHLHKEYTVRAAQKKIHVLCEKPMAVTSQECKEMIRACDENQVKLMIAYRLHFEEATLKAAHILNQEKKLGNSRMFQSIHSQAINYPNIRALPISQGGGPTYDIGIYDINAARTLFGDNPTSVLAISANSGLPEFKEIEETMSVVLKFPNERLASIVYSFGTVQTDMLRVVGTRGELSLEPAYDYVGAKKLSITVDGNTSEETIEARDQFAPEIDYFSDCILTNKSIEPSGEEGLADIAVIEAIFQSAKIGKGIELSLPKKVRNPDLNQEIDRPAFDQPEPFHAKSPSKDEAA